MSPVEGFPACAKNGEVVLAGEELFRFVMGAIA
jgi:hypothetical protein